MHHSHAVRLLESLGDFGPVAQHQFHGQASLSEARTQGFALEKFHDDEVNAVLLAEIVELADVGVAQLRDCTSFALEALKRCRLLGELCGKNLDGDRAIETLVNRAIDL